MASKIWKTFTFFESSSTKLPVDQFLTDGSRVTSACSGMRHILLGLSNGTMVALSSKYQKSATWKAHDAGPINHAKYIESRQILVTIAEDLINAPEMKVWALKISEKRIFSAQQLLSVRITTPAVFPITSFSVAKDVSEVAVAFANGSIVLVRGDLIHDRGNKQRVIHESNEPITGMEFMEEGGSSALYVTTTERVMTIKTAIRGHIPAPRVLETTGCALGCLTIDKNLDNILVARNDALYYYGPDGRGPCYAYEGSKSLIHCFGAYVIMLLPPQTTPNQTGVASSLRQLVGPKRETAYEVSTLVILDTDLQFIAHSETFTGGVKEVLYEWRDIHIVTPDNKVIRLKEKLLPDRLSLLYQRDLYPTALKLAQKSNVNAADINQINSRYADFLFSKGDYDNAMDQYIQAIQHTQPSQIIRKFLEIQRIPNLIQYLEELHHHAEYVTIEHTTLLLNCYAKLKDVEKLESFIRSDKGQKFDLNTVISLCRQAGYFDQAVYLAQKNSEHDIVMDVYMGDMRNFDEGLGFLGTLEPDAMHRNLMKWGRLLLDDKPEQTTELFKSYYTGGYVPRTPSAADEPVAPAPAVGGLQHYAYFIPSLGISGPAAAAPDIKPIEPPKVIYDIPPPQTAFSLFVDHPKEFVKFLRALLEKNGDKTISEVHLTLFEMYLHNANQEEVAGERDALHGQAKKQLKESGSAIGVSEVLLLSHLCNYQAGTTMVREEQQLFFDIFRSHTSSNETAKVMETLKKYGDKEPQLYIAALAYLISNPQHLSEADDGLLKVLEFIEKEGLLAPLQVVQILSKNGIATVRMIREYLSGMIERERLEIQRDQGSIDRYRQDTLQRKKEISDLENKPVIFQPSRCSLCGTSLELPAVHFMCKHSFHQRCLNTPLDSPECPTCAADNAAIRAIRQAQEDVTDQFGVFKTVMGSAESDRFAAVTGFFSRGIMKDRPI
ncbi:hypothetical protein DRE_04119 [Drechslerella stenobrocha 248]|uniref:E3 ubiquitin-protein ligase PEP5 n=1 Tax=Drechslerella stenobrocha 248 TaxID=1043628 RepID=W7I2K8_9PEZI|nr:hypothetical protein DRE_04119 [Drechslerella stenobrocha 248]